MIAELSNWFLGNWEVIVPITLSIIAIIFSALKDFILPMFFKPRLEISYGQKWPYKRQVNIVDTGSNQRVLGFFYRFKIKNVGRGTAKNCRCQIYSIKSKEGNELNLDGFPVRWASRPDSKERLNISQGESEFIDLASTRINSIGYFYFEPYHNVPIGMDGQITLNDYILRIIISGDNFKPYFATFRINGQPKEKHILEITLESVGRK